MKAPQAAANMNKDVRRLVEQLMQSNTLLSSTTAGNPVLAAFAPS